MRKPWRENPKLDRKSLQVRQVPKYYRAMLVELLDEPMAREKVLKYLDRFQYDPLIAGSGEKPEGNAQYGDQVGRNRLQPTGYSRPGQISRHGGRISPDKLTQKVQQPGNVGRNDSLRNQNTSNSESAFYGRYEYHCSWNRHCSCLHLAIRTHSPALLDLSSRASMWLRTHYIQSA